MIYLAELREIRTFTARINAISKADAERLLRARIADGLDPDTIDSECDVFSDEWCEACQEHHVQPCPPPRKPAESQLIPPSWERKQL